MMTISSYRELFGISIRHSYWLNSGVDEFDDMNAVDQQSMLDEYDFRKLLTVVPLSSSMTEMTNQRLLFRLETTGIKVITKTLEGTLTPLIPIDDNMELTFLLKRLDTYYDTYTDLTHAVDRICLFTNKQPSELVTPVEIIDLLSVDALVTDDFLLSPADTLTMLETIPHSERAGLVGIIRMYAKGDSSSFHLTTGADNLKASPPQFKIHFKNKHTFWKYRKDSENFEIETNTAKPLTKNGYIEIDPNTDFDSPSPEALTYKYPNPGLSTFEVGNSKLYSVIFI